MRSKHPIPRSPRNLQRQETAPRASTAGRWALRALWVLIGAAATGLITFLSQGPDAIRRIPEIPRAAYETFSRSLEEYRINKALTHKWIAGPLRSQGVEGAFAFELDMTCTSDGCGAAVTSPAMQHWSPMFGIVNAAGERRGRSVRLDVFDWVYGKRVEIAELEIEFQLPPDDGLSDHEPKLVEDVLTVSVKRQGNPVLPIKFELRRQ